MILRFLSVFALLLLVACAGARVQTITGPDGSPHQLVTCENVTRCYEAASSACGGKYQIVNTSNDIFSPGGRFATTSTTNLLVKCLNLPTPAKP